MENQQTIAEQQQRQERREAASKLLRILENSPLDEALLLSCSMVAVLLRSAQIEPDTRRAKLFFHSFRQQVEDIVETLDSAPSWLCH